MERLFTKAMKRHLYTSSDGRCHRCGGNLGTDWEAHHVNRYADGGITEITNAAALCKRCHVAAHRRLGVIKPRGWQQAALRKFESTTEPFLLEATPGAGKTIFSALCARLLLKEVEENERVDFCVVVVPTTALKGDSEAGFLGDWHKVGVEVTTVLKEGRDAPSGFAGGIITYQQLPNIIATFESWSRKGVRLFAVFDELHHASETNTWGAATDRLGAISTRVLGMTGTPFRSDGKRIAFLRYDDDGIAQADHKYGYSEAVYEKVCRHVIFMTDDGMAEYMLNDELQQVRISESTDEDAGRASSVIYKGDSEWLRKVLIKADAKLDEYRTYDLDAGGIVICRPGTDESDDRYIRQVAKLIKEVTGEAPEVITHDDPDANAKIERFRRGTDRWICSVRKISEGVDIKRLRVELLATRPSSELLFRQLVGRVVRVDDPNKPGDATVFMAKFRQLGEWAERISAEAEAGLAAIREASESQGEPAQSSDFLAVGSTHEDGGAITDFGEAYLPGEIAAAENLKRENPSLADTPVSIIALIQRKSGAVIPTTVEFGKPLHLQKKEMREKINKLTRRIAIARNSDNPDFKAVWVSIHRQIGAKSIDDLMDNHDISVMRQAESLLKQMLISRDDAA